jgi:hypothetical protein
VLPTTATLHWVAWAPDPFARVVVRQAADRVVPHAELKATLRLLIDAGAEVERVFIYAPIERLKRAEILDTPGFNAPDPAHVAAARRAFDEAHVAIWLFDATAPMKESERKVLAEIRDLDVPVQILVNKADRLPSDDVADVLEHVRQGLAASGLISHGPPVAFSARLSLQGRLGDDAALARSSWLDVEGVFSTCIVDHSEALRERALRRKARHIADDLAGVALARAVEDEAEMREARARSESMRAGAAKLRRDRASIAQRVEHELREPRIALAADLRPIAELPDERRRDLAVAAYARDRIVTRLAEPLAREIARAAAVTSSPRAIATVRAVLAGASAAHDVPAAVAEGASLERVVDAAVESFAAALLADTEIATPAAPFAALAARAAAMREAFARAAARH